MKLTVLSIRTKLSLLFAGLFLLAMLAVTVATVMHERRHMLALVQRQAVDLTTWYFDSLNTLMLTGSMEQRSILRDKLLQRKGVVEARVIRGEPVKRQFGPGLEHEQARDELDRRALRGEQVIEFGEGPAGRVLTVVTPFRATADTRGVNCLRCHQVEPGAVNGAVRIGYSLAEVDADIQRSLQHYLAINLAVFGVGFLLANLLLRRWVTQPLQHFMDVIERRADGDDTAWVAFDGEDEMGQLGRAFNQMAENIKAVSLRERENAMQLQKKVDQLLHVTRRVRAGDFDVQVGFAGEDAIGELASSLQAMIDAIRQNMLEKKQAMEHLQRRVDAILAQVEAVARGDLGRRVSLQGDDALAQLARGVQDTIDNLAQLVRQLQSAGVQVATTANEISSSMLQVEQSALKQAAATEQITATATEICATTGELVDTMDEVAQVAEQASTTAVHSHAGLARMEAMMRQLVEHSSLVADRLDGLSEKASGIGAVVTTIGKVADQTNLLSLNAAIEAEKAGEAGRGFAVVAAEIRRLADQSAVATLDIEQMIREVQGAVDSGVRSAQDFTALVQQAVDEVKEVSRQQTEIINQVETLGPRFESVRQAMHFQSEGGEQINAAISQLNNDSKRAVKSLRLVKLEVQKLGAAARALHASVSRFFTGEHKA